MLEGIEILQTIEVVTHTDIWLAFIILSGVVIVAFLFAMVTNDIDIYDIDIQTIIVGCVLAIVLIGSIIMYKRSAKMHTEYIVTVDQNVNVIEFFDKYEVIEHKDKLWRIKEKDND